MGGPIDSYSVILFKWLNRRSRRRSFNWQGFNNLLDHYGVPRPRVIPKSRIEKPAAIQLAAVVAHCLRLASLSANQSLRVDAEASISEEPGAEKPHAGICAGAAG